MTIALYALIELRFSNSEKNANKLHKINTNTVYNVTWHWIRKSIWNAFFMYFRIVFVYENSQFNFQNSVCVCVCV